MALEVIEKNYFRNHHSRCGTENCSAESAKQAQLQISNNGRLRPMGAISNNCPVLYKSRVRKLGNCSLDAGANIIRQRRKNDKLWKLLCLPGNVA